MMVNWLLTRRCNLACNLCKIRKNSISQNQELAPDIIKSIALYLQSSKVTTKFGDPFFILYGGEPFIRDDIEEILSIFQDIAPDSFTIYHNGTMIDKVISIAKNLKLKRLTSSIDVADYDKSRNIRNNNGIKLLTMAQGKAYVEDAVATITLDGKSDMTKLIPLVEELTRLNITANITTFDPPGGKWYDFSIKDNIKQYVVYKEDVKDIFDELCDRSDLKILRRDLLKVIPEVLPRNYRCNNPLNAITIDYDGFIRLCLRIGKTLTSYCDLLNDDVTLDDLTADAKKIQNLVCNGCVWTCIMMSELTEE